MSQQLPAGSLVLVSGANGFIGSHVIDQILHLGYHVRGTVRDPQKNAWVQGYFDKKYGAGKFSLVQVKDFTQSGCFDEAAKGCDGFAHVASDLNFNTDPNAVVTPMIAGVKHALEAAAKEPKMKSFVLTSSSTAATAPKPNKKFHIGKETWNEEDVKQAWADKWEDDGRRKWAVYGASKTQGEQELWKFMKEKKPQFKANAILPNANFGPILDVKHQQGSTAGWHTAVLQGKVMDLAPGIPAQYFVAVKDTARMHAAAVTDLSYNGERFYAFTSPFNWNDVVDIICKYAPADKTKDLPQKVDPEDARDLSTVDNANSLALLKARYGQEKFVTFDEAMQENIKSSLEALAA